jgi:prophage antirepressor-like protein
MAAQLISVNFHDQSLVATVHKGQPYIAMKPICENLGLQWQSQFNRIKRHPILKQVVFMTDTTSIGQDGKTYNASNPKSKIVFLPTKKNASMYWPRISGRSSPHPNPANPRPCPTA